LTVDFTEVILVVLLENLPCCYRAREGSTRVTTTTIFYEELYQILFQSQYR